MRVALRLTAIVLAAFLLTSTIMFWLIVFEARSREYGYDTFVPNPFSDWGWRGGDCCTPLNEDEIKRRASTLERGMLDQIFNELRSHNDQSLLQMKAFDDICANGLVDCRNIPTAKVKPFIEAVLADRQRVRDIANGDSARNANYLAAGSLFVAFLALVFSALTYFRKRSHVEAR
jgi:hypothetical protein